MNLTAAIGLGIAAATGAAQQGTLHNGQQVVLHGTLQPAPAGRLQFITIRTDGSFRPPSPSQPPSQPGTQTHAIALSGFHDYALLYAHRGQQVTVRGNILTETASPYYWHGALLSVQSIADAKGTSLLGEPPQPRRLAADVGSYQAQVVLPADLAEPWHYLSNGKPDADRRFLSCSSNGGGDVVNCACAEGFHATAATSAITGHTSPGRLMDIAQFEVGDTPRRVQISVTCSR